MYGACPLPPFGMGGSELGFGRGAGVGLYALTRAVGAPARGMPLRHGYRCHPSRGSAAALFIKGIWLASIVRL